MHARRKLRNVLWHGQSTSARDPRGRGRQILSVAGITAGDRDEVTALLLQKCESWCDGLGDRTFGADAVRGGHHSRRFPFVVPNTEKAGYLAISTLGCQHCSRFAVALCRDVRALVEEQLHDARRDSVRSGR